MFEKRHVGERRNVNSAGFNRDSNALA